MLLRRPAFLPRILWDPLCTMSTVSVTWQSVSAFVVHPPRGLSAVAEFEATLIGNLNSMDLQPTLVVARVYNSRKWTCQI